MFTVMARKTTILLREDVHQALVEIAGKRNISAMINEILVEYFSRKGSMFGTMKKVDVSDLRDHRERL